MNVSEVEAGPRNKTVGEYIASNTEVGAAHWCYIALDAR